MREPSIPNATVADAAACRDMLRGGSRTFFAASLVLPDGIRKPATSLYAFCRMADDAIDRGSDCGAALSDLRIRLDRIYADAPCNLVCDRAFADVVSRFGIPKAFPAALLEGFEWDASGRRYQNLSQLTEYAVRVAGTVGAMMAMIMGVRDARLLARACDLGVAMQLTNIARDVGEDAQCGRIYLPLEWLREADIDAQQWLARPSYSTALGGVIERLLDTADLLYARSESGLANLPGACRPGMYAARRLYAAIGHEVARRKFDSVSQRAVVPWPRKARILADALIAAKLRTSSIIGDDVLPEAHFLLGSLPESNDAASLNPFASSQAKRRPPLEERMVWLIDLFERLERRERTGLHSAQT